MDAAGHLEAAATDRWVADVAAADAAAAEAIAAAAHGETYRDVTERALAIMEGDEERTQNVHEFFRHGSTSSAAPTSATSTRTGSTKI